MPRAAKITSPNKQPFVHMREFSARLFSDAKQHTIGYNLLNFHADSRVFCFFIPLFDLKKRFYVVRAGVLLAQLFRQSTDSSITAAEAEASGRAFQIMRRPERTGYISARKPALDRAQKTALKELFQVLLIYLRLAAEAFDTIIVINARLNQF